jgi:hypothetical protein
MWRKIFFMVVVLVSGFVGVSQGVLAAGSTAQQIDQVKQALTTITATIQSLETAMKSFIDTGCNTADGYSSHKSICDTSKTNLLNIKTKLGQDLTVLKGACASLSAADKANYCKDVNNIQTIFDNLRIDTVNNTSGSTAATAANTSAAANTSTTSNSSPTANASTAPNANTNGGLVPCGTGDNPPCTLCHLVIGVQGIVDWAIRVMTFFAIAVIVAMGILYIVSAGNSGMITMAKNGIKTTLFGFAIVLGSWVIINYIIITLANNGVGHATSWHTFTCDTTSSALTGGGGAGGGPTPVGPGGALTCTTGACATNAAVSQAVKNNASGVDPNTVMAIIDGGESCNKSLSTDGFGSCGYSQALPAIRTKCGITGTPSETCAKIQNDVQLDINCAAWLIKDNAGRCGLDINNVASCYNSGKPNNCPNTTSNYCGRVSSYFNSCPK